jgi:hypothetical protein
VADTEESSWEDATEIESERNKSWACSLEISALLVRRFLAVNCVATPAFSGSSPHLPSKPISMSSMALVVVTLEVEMKVEIEVRIEIPS